MKSLLKISLALLIGFSLFLSSCSESEDENSIVVRFDSLNLSPNSFWNGSDKKGSFHEGGVTFPNYYNSEWSSWNGYAYSNMHDIKTPGYGNQYSSYALKDSNSNNTFVVFYPYDEPNELIFDNPVTDVEIKVTNSTYAALSMKYGDGTGKKFGGADSTENDWFKLQIIGIDKSGVVTDTANVYLADFRYSSKKMDYILNSWLSVDLLKLGEVKKLKFLLSSSDNGIYGMNTPGYFCLDDLEYKPVKTTE